MCTGAGFALVEFAVSFWRPSFVWIIFFRKSNVRDRLRFERIRNAAFGDCISAIYFADNIYTVRSVFTVHRRDFGDKSKSRRTAGFPRGRCLRHSATYPLRPGKFHDTVTKTTTITKRRTPFNRYPRRPERKSSYSTVNIMWNFEQKKHALSSP